MIYASTIHAAPSRAAQEYLAGWQRARAELDNFRKRMQEQQNIQHARRSKEILSSFLPLADNFQAMTAHLPDDLQHHAWAEGVLHIARQFEQLLRELGLTTIIGINQPFDPRQHEAVKTVKQRAVPSGQVLEIIQPGYAWHDEVIRPAKVKVAA
ncbi:MAG TPA: nucleotide exchange factor GrpE [Candidatus Andersenbacteria bacterium]|nr:nucleotide exchange factor GrpE [Candidatus Andersenbacteria bacterium]